MTEEMELVCFQLIANSGAAKSSFVEAIQAAKKGLFEDAKTKLVEAEEAFVEAHKIHAELIQKEAGEAYGFYNSSNVKGIKCELGGVGIHFVHLL